MSEVIENNLVGDNQPEYSVSEISGVVVEFQIPDLVISIWILRMKGQF